MVIVVNYILQHDFVKTASYLLKKNHFHIFNLLSKYNNFDYWLAKMKLDNLYI